MVFILMRNISLKKDFPLFRVSLQDLAKEGVGLRKTLVNTVSKDPTI